MKRMPAAERVALEATARPIAKLYVQRATQEDARRTAQSLIPLLQDVMKRGHFAFATMDNASLHLSAQQQWVVDVTWILRGLNERIGQCAADVLIARLVRPRATERSGFARIAFDVSDIVSERTGNLITLLESEAESLYQRALPKFVALLDERGIGRDPRPVDAPRAPYRPWVEPESQRSLIAMGRRLQRFGKLATQRLEAERAARRAAAEGARQPS